jgi:hypothetical protein
MSEVADQLLLTGVGLALASIAAGFGHGTVSQISENGTLSSQTFAQVVFRVESQDIVRELSSLHDRLLARTTELDPEAKAVLYSNLWDLYSE